MKRHLAPAFFFALTCLAASLIASPIQGCAHVNTPSGFVQCMENPKDEAVVQRIVNAALDADGEAELEALFAAAPDLLKCFLTPAAATKAAGGAEAKRAAKARAFLDKHGMSMSSDGIYQKREGGWGSYGPAAGAGRLPSRDRAADVRRSGPGAGAPGVLLSWRMGFCPFTCIDEPPPGIGPGPGGG